MGIGANVRNVVQNVINDLGTEVTLLSVAPTKNAYGFTTSYAVLGTGTVKCVPSRFFKRAFTNQAFGQMNEGETRMLFPPGTAFTDLKGTADNWRAVMTLSNFTGTYVPKSEKPIILDNLEVAHPVVFVIEEESGY